MIELLQGDCLDILPTLADKSVDAIITDIPYGTTACKWDVIIPLDKMWEQVKRLCKGAFVTTASQPFTSVLIMSNLQWFKYEWVWHKNRGLGFQHAQNMPIKQHENIVVFSRNPMGHKSILGDRRMIYNPLGVAETGEIKVVSAKKHGQNLGARPNQVGRAYKVKTGFPVSVLDFQSVTTNEGEHPTQKPVALYEYLIKTYTNEGDTVLDFCMGSGTTLVACVNTNRNGIGIEREKSYFDIAQRRVKEAQQQMTMEFV